MIKLGEIQELKMIQRSSNGIYLAPLTSDGPETPPIENAPRWVPEKPEKVLLPNNQTPEEIQNGDTLMVFVYKDSEDRPIATTTVPKLTLGQIARLKVASVEKIGAFLEWGLLKDLFLPFKEQKKRVTPGDEVLVSLYIDKSERLCATMNLYPYLRTDSPYHKDDRVQGTIYETQGNFGVFVAVDDLYSGLIPKKEVFREYSVGETIEARITNIREDGKLDLSVREKNYRQMDSDSAVILEALQKADGFLPYHDKTDAQTIKTHFSISKNAFKRAVGHLLKERKITIEADGIRLVSKSK